MAWWTLEDLEDRLSAYEVAELLDDDNEGQVKGGPLERLQRDSDSYVGAALQDVYPDYPFDGDGDVVPNECIRLSLDAAEMFLARRHPEVIQLDWKDLRASLKEDLDMVRTAKRSLAQSPPDPAANHGGAVYPTPDPTNDQYVPIFVNGGWRGSIF